MISDLHLKDFVSRPVLEALQLRRMQFILKHAYEHSPFYTKAMDKLGVKPSDLRQLSDLSKFPFTQKTDLRDTYPYGLNAVPNSDIVRIHASSGTTGKPIVVTYTQGDLDIWSETTARCFLMGGCSNEDITVIGYGYSLFTGGMGAHQGMERIGATVIPMGGGNSEKLCMMIKDLNVTAICCTPSYFIHVMEVAEKIGLDLRTTNLRHGFFGAEPWTDEKRDFIEKKSGILAHDIFGLSEIMGPGVAGDCECHSGLHVFEDHYFPEIVDPDTGEVLPPGTEGELVLTTLDKMAMPLLRYRTHDISCLHYERCECGRTMVRMDRIRRRSDDMLIIRGVNLFPSQVESLVMGMPGVVPHYELIVTREHAMDELEIRVEVTPEVIAAGEEGQAKLARAIHVKIKQMVGISAKISLADPGAIARCDGKTKHIIDKRNK
ncbi:MAG: phenylacetate--CoA ligase [Victivallales bacterium]|nr:phenylacetate--CoA ligase [Victivallales bacterium]